MKLDNKDLLIKLHPNYEKEKEKVELLFSFFLKLSGKDHTKYLKPGYRIVHSKNYAFSKQLKEIYYRDSDRSIGIDLAYNYNKNGSLSMVQIQSKNILNALCPTISYDGVDIMYEIQQVNFYQNGQNSAVIRFTQKNGEYLLSDYSI